MSRMAASGAPSPSEGVIGQAWYTPESFRQLEEAIAAAGMPRTMLCSYAEFVTRFGDMARGFERQGFRVEKVPVDVPHMVAWCKRWGLEINNAGRTRYVGMLGLSDGDREKLDKMPVVDRTRVQH
jgi:hypothetical protein